MSIENSFFLFVATTDKLVKETNIRKKAMTRGRKRTAARELEMIRIEGKHCN